jgi:hypothetical protein
MMADGDMVLDRFDDCLARSLDKNFLYYGEDDMAVTYMQAAP